ncbi:MAG: glucosamine 6-phosphate synthetase, contains amidotransferase and phosphosugar isomerase domain [Acidimicrobiales bacterium]|jgi:glucosamine--fructose-6-phosphate aminotransferase (isomerizing)|nr:glucosamine 6-phosphate synthetase, contains amidotransferase and phosphosugar isomerase domain [Acidimicrobiales bacterium]
MCGIVAVLRRRSTATPPDASALLADVEAAWAAVATGLGGVAGAAARLADVDARLRGVPGVRALIGSAELVAELVDRMGRFDAAIAAFESELDAGARHGAELEDANAAIVRLKDAVWAISRDRLRTADAVVALAGVDAGPAAIEGFTSVQLALSAIDRLEVRGRDSAGLHLFVTGHGVATADPELVARTRDPLFTSMAVRAVDGGLSFVYKAAAEIGELGDNVRQLRASIAGDELLHRALEPEAAEVVVLGHTRWASVGIISQPNAHPLNDEEVGRAGPYVVAALNGDVDNELDLKRSHALRLPPEITTDAKVIPMLMSRAMAGGAAAAEAFRATVAEFHGSVAIGAHAADAPGHIMLALRGSGQGVYVGLADDAFLVASEPYGLVEETSRYLRMDGETTGGQVVVLDGAAAGTIAGISRLAYDGTALPVADEEIVAAEITTRDIDRAGFSHFLLKEITEAPQSFRKTLRGKVVDAAGGLTVVLGDETLPPAVRERLRTGRITRVVAIGQGTAAVAGQSLASAVAHFLPPTSGVSVAALPATELSGFGLADDMSDTLVVAISQSGTTTDTNRTVDLARARGAAVLAVVNRRNSDLVEKADGVLYTSDGRDVEMSVASTKAFYAQVAAGFVVAIALATEVTGRAPDDAAQVLADLRRLPDAMEQVLALRPEIADIAQQHAPSRRSWALVGNGPNRVAAQELRIKLSELCYKSIACDATEDKKHIDLSSEPMVLVCATGLPEATASDVAKEIAIYRAHKAAPIVIATEGDEYPAALAVIHVPRVHPRLAFVLAAMAGHVFGYEAALSIDGQARVLREARAAIEAVASGGGFEVIDGLAARLERPASAFFAGLRSGAYNGHLEVATAVRLASLLRFATGALPVEAYELEYGKVGSPAAIIEDLTDALTRGIDELTRPIDAIKHQAKTVTVGISRSEDDLFGAPLVVETLAAGSARDRLSYRVLRTLTALGPAVDEVTGYTRYRVEGNVGDGTATIHVVDKGGVARDLVSRSESEDRPLLRGTKHRAATLREVIVAEGARDGRTVLIVPETKDSSVTGVTLLHARFADRLDGAAMRAVLEGYQGRYAALVDAVTETEPRFDDERLAGVPVIDLLTSPVHVLAQHWRR